MDARRDGDPTAPREDGVYRLEHVESVVPAGLAFDGYAASCEPDRDRIRLTLSSRLFPLPATGPTMPSRYVDGMKRPRRARQQIEWGSL